MSGPEAAPHFPPPRAPEPLSPYRERIAPPARTPPAERGRLVVTRPEPPALEPRAWWLSGSRGLEVGPLPAGWLDELGRALRPLARFVDTHLPLCALILLIVFALTVGTCGRAVYRGHYNG